jgi:hypothetical protein
VTLRITLKSDCRLFVAKGITGARILHIRENRNISRRGKTGGFLLFTYKIEKLPDPSF